MSEALEKPSPTLDDCRGESLYACLGNLTAIEGDADLDRPGAGRVGSLGGGALKGYHNAVHLRPVTLP